MSVAADAPSHLTVMDVLAAIRLTARNFGYAVAVHGSLSRDLDVIAVPWIERPAYDAPQLAEELRAAVNGIFAPGREGPMEKPHGRLVWSIHIFNPLTYIDLSVMPTRES